MMKKTLILLTSVVLLSGCAHVISKETLKEVDQIVTFAELLKDPSRYRGKVMLLGGVVVETLIEKDGTLLEIYQTRMDKGGKPTDLDRSEGRFLAHYKGFLDSEIWRKGRKVTVAGTVEGEKIQKLGDIDYRYPYLRVREIHLWKEESYTYEPYPWGPWDPWWDPFWHPYWYRHPPYRHRHR